MDMESTKRDFSNVLRVAAELAGKVKGSFPSFLRKTDEERVQNLAKEYNE